MWNRLFLMAFHCSSSDPVSQNASISGRENGINGIKCILGSKCWLCQHQAELGHPFLLHQEFPLSQQCLLELWYPTLMAQEPQEEPGRASQARKRRINVKMKMQVRTDSTKFNSGTAQRDLCSLPVPLGMF